MALAVQPGRRARVRDLLAARGLGVAGVDVERAAAALLGWRDDLEAEAVEVGSEFEITAQHERRVLAEWVVGSEERAESHTGHGRTVANTFDSRSGL